MAPYRALAVLACLAGCSSPGVTFLGASPVEVTHDGVRHDVYVAAGRVQVIRMGSTLGLAAEDLGPFYEGIAERATGCRVDGRTRRVDGSVMTARLTCPDGGALQGAPQ